MPSMYMSLYSEKDDCSVTDNAPDLFDSVYSHALC